MTLEGMITECESHLGLSGRPNLITNWYASRNGSAFATADWCEMYITYCAYKSGNYAAVNHGKDYAYTVWHAQEFQRMGEWTVDVAGIKRGDIAYFDWAFSNSISAIDHVGVVTKVDGTNIHTIEGNTSDSVARRIRQANTIVGYGRPKYAPEVQPVAFIQGRDVSGWNESLPSYTGFDFVVVKATEATSFINSKRNDQVNKARNEGKVVGHYHYASGTANMQNQVNHFLSVAPSRADEFLVLDWEDPNITASEKDLFLDLVKAARPTQRVLLYCNLDYWRNRQSSGKRGDGLWIAQWGTDAGEPNVSSWILHQYTDTPYDKNVANFQTKSAFASWVSASAPPPDPDPVPNPQVPVMYDVIDNESLLSAAQNNNLTVNELIDLNLATNIKLKAQQLLVGYEDPPLPADPYAGGLPHVNESSPSAQPLQIELKRVGYLADSVALNDNYGPMTQSAVSQFYLTNSWMNNPGGTQIGPTGWAHLRTEPTGEYSSTPPSGSSEPAHDYTRGTFSVGGGKTINQRTKTMLDRAVTLLTAYTWTPYLTQGSYNPGVSASAGTHDGGGVIDIRTSTMTLNGQWLCVQALRRAGFAAWLRTPADGFTTHIHACAIGDREMAAVAERQVQSYFNGRNGLANNGPDNAPGWVGRVWPSWANQYNL